MSTKDSHSGWRRRRRWQRKLPDVSVSSTFASSPSSPKLATAPRAEPTATTTTTTTVDAATAAVTATAGGTANVATATATAVAVAAVLLARPIRPVQRRDGHGIPSAGLR